MTVLPGDEGAAPADASGVVVRFDPIAAEAAGIPSLAFVDAGVARRVALATAALDLGGAAPLRVGIALVEGRVLTSIAVGDVAPRGPVVVCERPGGEPVALAVRAVVASGVLARSGGEILAPGGGAARALDVAALLAHIEGAVWAPRTRGATVDARASTNEGAALPITRSR
jgi:hypothetical protein